jgi:KICSTOR complex protein kaptin
LSNPVVLFGTDSQDCLTCSSICDIDLDGKNELLLGTFGKVCFICRIPIDNYKSNQIDGLAFPTEVFPVCLALPLSASAFGITAVDLTHDGLEEIILATTKGLHIYQLELHEVAKLIDIRLREKNESNVMTTVIR